MTRLSRIAAATWKDPAVRAKRIAGLSRHAKNTLWAKGSSTRRKLLQHLKTFSKAPEQRKANSERMRAKWADPKYRARMLVHRKASYTPERMARVTKAAQDAGAWNKGLTKETDLRVAALSAKLVGHIPKFGNYRAWYEGPKGSIYMRSKWEVAYAMYLDRCGVAWEYESRAFTLEGVGTYTPDFYLSKTRQYIEIKGYFSNHHRAKFSLFRTVYPAVSLAILFKGDLEKLGILDAHGRAVLSGANKK